MSSTVEGRPSGNYDYDTAVYIGNNSTTRQWFETLPEEQQQKALP